MRRISRFTIASVLALSVLVGGSIAMWPASASSVTKVVKMTNALRYMPMTITVHKGDQIKWRNVSSAGLQHTSTSKTWNSGVLNPGQSFTRRFNALGTFKYHCMFHGSQGMLGSIKVVA